MLVCEYSNRERGPGDTADSVCDMLHTMRAALIACLLVILVGTELFPATADRRLSDSDKKDAVYEMYRNYKRDDFPGVPDISPDSAMALADSGWVVFVDDRTDAEREVSTLPGAVSREEFVEHIDRYRDATIVAYCTISYRSGGFVQEMAGRGLKIYNLRGGILAWLLEGGRVYHDGEETHRVHVYGDRWDYAPAGYETVKFGPVGRFLRWLF